MMKRLLLAVVTLALMVSCDRYLDSRDPAGPAPPEGLMPVLSAVPLSNYQVMLVWDGVETEGFAAGRLFRDTNADVTTADDLVTTLTSASIRAFVDTTVGPATTYYYRLYVTNLHEATGASNVATATTESNSPPLGVTLSAVMADASTARLSWTRSAEQDFRSYQVYWKQSIGVDTTSSTLAVIENKDSTTYAYYLPPSLTVYYRVYVRDRQGLLSQGSNVVSVTSPAP